MRKWFYLAAAVACVGLLTGLGSVDVSPLFHEYRANSHRVYGRRPQTSVSAVPSVHGMPM